MISSTYHLDTICFAVYDQNIIKCRKGRWVARWCIWWLSDLESGLMDLGPTNIHLIKIYLCSVQADIFVWQIHLFIRRENIFRFLKAAEKIYICMYCLSTRKNIHVSWTNLPNLYLLVCSASEGCWIRQPNVVYSLETAEKIYKSIRYIHISRTNILHKPASWYMQCN